MCINIFGKHNISILYFNFLLYPRNSTELNLMKFNKIQIFTDSIFSFIQKIVYIYITELLHLLQNSTGLNLERVKFNQIQISFNFLLLASRLYLLQSYYIYCKIPLD